MSYTYTTTETEQDHAEREGVDETTREAQWCDKCEKYDAACGHTKQVDVVLVICSCGFYTCGLITRYGLIEPLFKVEIEPIPSQFQRDRRALELREVN